MEDRGTFCCRSSPFSSFRLQLPPAPHTVQGVHRWPHHPPGRSAYIQSCSGRSAVGPGSAPCLRPAGYRVPETPLPAQELMLQLLPLAQAACDYLKPQPIIYEKREPDVRLIDGHLLKYRLVQWKGKPPSSAWIMELFLDLWVFLFPFLIEVITWSYLLIEKGNLFSQTSILSEQWMRWGMVNLCVVT